MYNVTGVPQDIGGSRSPRLIKAHGKLHLSALTASSKLAEIEFSSLLLSISSSWHSLYFSCWVARFEVVKAVKLLIILNFRRVKILFTQENESV